MQLDSETDSAPWPPKDDLLRMGEAIAHIEPHIVYQEAKRQYEALVSERDAQINMSSAPTIGSTCAQQSIDLAHFYRSRFHEATPGLGKLEKYQLLTLCFAYKTKARVLQYLDTLVPDAYPWIGLFQELVRDYGRDSFFEEDPHLDTYSNPSGAASTTTDTKQLHDNDPSPYTFGSKTAIANSGLMPQNGRYFIIPTLPLAFTTCFFAAFALHAPLDCLTVPSLLAYPAAMGLVLSDQLKDLLRSELPAFWKHNLPSGPFLDPDQERQIAEEEASWAALFEHLLMRRATLIYSNGTELEVPTDDDDDGDGDGEDGYAEADLKMWLAVWTAERQSVGNKEKGQETRLKINLGLDSGGATVESTKDEGSDGGGPRGIDQLDEKGKRVSWNEDALVKVQEIPSSPWKIMRKAGKW